MRVSCEHCGGAHPKYECRHKKSSGGSSEVEHRPSKSGVEGSIPSRRSKKSTAPSESRTSRSRSANESLPFDTNPEPLTLPVGEKQPRTSQPQGTRNEGMPTIPKPKHIDRHKPGYMASYMRAYRARKSQAKKLGG